MLDETSIYLPIYYRVIDASDKHHLQIYYLNDKRCYHYVQASQLNVEGRAAFRGPAIRAMMCPRPRH